MQRVGGNTDAASYIQVGKEAAAQLMAAAVACLGSPVRDVLDWGCGPGRVASHISRDYPEAALQGCDIDTEAVAWCNGHIAGRFGVSPLYPPLAYAADTFDVVLACSVMTHLPRRVQRLWLREIARILRPGGVLAATVHGLAAAAIMGCPDLPGIEDRYLDGNLDGVAPVGYYRDVLQTEEYTRDAWSDHFEIVEYQKTAIGFQDLAVCRVLPLSRDARSGH